MLEIIDLCKYFPLDSNPIFRFVGRESVLKAVDRVSLTIHHGETLGLVGESGCGKSTLARLITRLIEPTAGEVNYQGEDIFKLKGTNLGRLRKDIQMVFQDPFGSLNPRRTIVKIVGRPMEIHGLAKGREIRGKVAELLTMVGLEEETMDSFPHEFSGGQRQRIAIARALAVNPKLIIADESVSSLDVSIQAQILNLFRHLQKELNLTYLFIAHDLSVVEHVSDRVAVMYAGQIMEVAPSESIFNSPLHPYTEALISAIPVPDPLADINSLALEGEVTTPINPPSGCRLQGRCPRVMDICHKKDPILRSVDVEHYVACHRYASSTSG